MFYALQQHAIPSSQDASETSGFPWPATYTEGSIARAATGTTLSITGLVATPLTLTRDALLALGAVTVSRRMVSAQRWTYRGEWTGVPLKTLLEKSTPAAEATWLRQTDAAGHQECLRLADALAGDALICTQAGGRDLTPLYGGPLRLLVFDRYDYKGLGQLSELALIDDATQAETSSFWAQQGYDAEGLIQPGPVYAFDLQAERDITTTTGEIIDW